MHFHWKIHICPFYLSKQSDRGERQLCCSSQAQQSAISRFVSTFCSFFLWLLHQWKQIHPVTFYLWFVKGKSGLNETQSDGFTLPLYIWTALFGSLLLTNSVPKSCPLRAPILHSVAAYKAGKSSGKLLCPQKLRIEGQHVVCVCELPHLEGKILHHKAFLLWLKLQASHGNIPSLSWRLKSWQSRGKLQKHDRQDRDRISTGTKAWTKQTTKWITCSKTFQSTLLHFVKSSTYCDSRKTCRIWKGLQ